MFLGLWELRNDGAIRNISIRISKERGEEYMKKIVLIGKLDDTMSELNDGLSKRFRVQLCDGSAELLQGMLNIVKPDLIVVNLVEMYENVEDMFQLIAIKTPNTPVISIVTEEQSEEYRQYFASKQFHELAAPIGNTELVNRCLSCLNVNIYDWHKEKSAETNVSRNGKKQIMIVDDSPLAIRSTKAIIGNDYDIVIATSGKQALQMMKTERPDLVLLDYEMPDCDGKMTLEKIREDEMLCDIPVIFVTGVADKAHIAAVLGMNPAGYFLKPLEKEKVLHAIEAIFDEQENE